MKKVLLFVLAVALTGCGHNPAGPSQPPTPPPPATGSLDLELRSGETEAMVSANVNVGGQSKPVSGAARFDNVKKGDLLDVVSHGFIDLQSAVYEFGHREIFLWPDRPGFSRQFTKELVYGGGSTPLRRPADGTTVALVPSATIRKDGKAMSALHFAADIISAANGEILFVVTTNPPAKAVRVDVRLNPSIPPQYGGWAVVGWGDHNTLTGGTIEFRTIDIPRLWQAGAHEMGHVYGLSHPKQLGGIMPLDASLFSVRDFSDAEKLGMHMMLLRPPGNQFPDNDRGISSSHAGVTRMEFFCQF